MSIKLKGSTDGSVTLQAPADTSPTGTDKTLTLPTGIGSANQFLQNGSTAGTLEFGALVSSDMPTGSILQVKSATKTDTMSHGNNTFVDIPDLSVSITPSSSSNKILVIAQLTGDGKATQTRAIFRLMRGSTPIGIADTAGSRARATFTYYEATDDQSPGSFGGHFLDSPNTTSATTYKVQIANGNNVQNVYVNRASGWSDSFAHAATISSITVMEVAA